MKLSDRDRELLAPLREPAPAGAQFGLNRYVYDIWRRDPALRARFPSLDRDGEAFVEWLHAYGQEQCSILPELLPPAPAAYHHFNPGTPVVGKVLPPDIGVNVLSFLRAELGTGEAGRLLVAAFDERRIPVLPMEAPTRPGHRHGHPFQTAAADGIGFPITITCANPDWMGLWAAELGDRFFRDRYSIGYWWWEVDGPTPFDWRRNFTLVDEVWTASEHIAEALRPALEVPVHTMTFPVSVPEPPSTSRAMLGLPDGFVFLTMFDYASTIRRKNPIGAIEAFRRTFAPGDGASLVVKCINQAADPDAHHDLLTLASEHPDICVIDRYVSPQEKNAMVALCDCYVSLHRAEGLGLPLAEAMYLGKPTIATRYSGNLEFQTDENSYLVPFELVPIGADGRQYPPNGIWAEPDIEQAAALMRRVYDDPAVSRAVGARAAHDIRATHSLTAAGIAMERRLEQIVREHGLAAEAPQVAATRVAARIARGPVAPARSRLGPARPLARRLLLRALRPYTAYQREVDEQFVAEIEQTRAALAEQERQLRQSELRVAAGRAADLARTRQRPGDPAEQPLESRVATLEQAVGGRHPLIPLERFETVVGRVEGYRERWPDTAAPDTYLEFEQLFRGSERTVRGRQERYLPVVGRRSPVLDIGCGRGEFLEILRDEGLEAHGVDVDPAMVTLCRDKGLDVAAADGIQYLEDRADGSLGIVFGAQVIEHLSYEEILRLLRAARAKLQPGGRLVLETVNPHAPVALRNFWIDPTHVHPLFPEVVLMLCRLNGFARGYIWHPSGTGDPELDRREQADYAVIAEVAGRDEATRPVEHAVSVATDVGELWYPAGCEVLTPAVQQAGRWDPEDAASIRAALAPGMVVLDVGAHVGYFALLAAECVGPTGKVLAVEPSPENFALLAANVERAGATQVVPVPAAAWRETGQIQLHLSGTNTGDHRVYSTGDPRETVAVRALALDELLANTERLDFAILDTQGSERAVLEGMRQSITRFRPPMQAEFWPEGIRAFGEDPATMPAFYRGLGYAVSVLGEDGTVLELGPDGTDAVELAEARPGGFCTLLLTPLQD